jgi:ferric-dicitrate binding protein FerR (iron transport regulator)
MGKSLKDTEDFLFDADFKKWVLNPDDAGTMFWTKFMDENPEIKGELLDAKKIVSALGVEENQLPKSEVKDLWKDIKTYSKKTRNKSSRKVAIAVWIAAAVLVGFVILTNVFRTDSSDQTVVFSNYGELKEITLPDDSRVTLNGNSKITYSTHFDDERTREVWLEGEAFFNVTKKSGTGQTKFLVHAEEVTVEVLGTSFNVTNRKANTKVILSTGSIKLHFENISNVKEIAMIPGDYIEYSKTDSRITKKKVNPDIYSAWTANKLMFDDISLFELTQIIHETYGLNVEISDSVLNRKRIKIAAPTNDVDILLKTLEKLFNLDIKREGDHVKINNKIDN